MGLLAVGSTLLSVVHLEVFHAADERASTAGTLLKVAMTTLTLVLECCIVTYHRNLTASVRIRNPLMGRLSMFNRPFVLPFLVEFLACLLHVPPGLERVVSDKWAILVGLRFFLMFRLMKDHSSVFGSGAKLVGAFAKVKMDWRFTLRMLLVKQPFLTIFAVLSFFLVALSHFAFVFERRARGGGYDDSGDAGRDASTPAEAEAMRAYAENLSFWEMVWMVYISMATVGYGDVTPRTNEGRIAVMIAAAIGLFTTALLVSVVYNYLSLNKSQEHVVHFLSTHHLRHMRRDLAARCIVTTFRLAAARRRGKRTRCTEVKLARYLDRLRHTRRLMSRPVDPLAVTTITLHEEVESSRLMITNLNDRLNAIHGLVGSLLPKLHPQAAAGFAPGLGSASAPVLPPVHASPAYATPPKHAPTPPQGRLASVQASTGHVRRNTATGIANERSVMPQGSASPTGATPTRSSDVTQEDMSRLEALESSVDDMAGSIARLMEHMNSRMTALEESMGIAD